MKRGAFVSDDDPPTVTSKGPGVVSQVFPSGASVAEEVIYNPYRFRRDQTVPSEPEPGDFLFIGSAMFAGEDNIGIVNFVDIDTQDKKVLVKTTLKNHRVHFRGISTSSGAVPNGTLVPVSVRGPVSAIAVGDPNRHQLAPLVPVFFEPFVETNTDMGIVDSVPQNGPVRKPGQMRVPLVKPFGFAPKTPVNNLYQIHALALSRATLDNRNATLFVYGA